MNSYWLKSPANIDGFISGKAFLWFAVVTDGQSELEDTIFVLTCTVKEHIVKA